jgi:CHASE3 domain sensor protein
VAVLFGLACILAAWQYTRVERVASAQQTAAASFERDARNLASAILEIRSAQQGYVAAGQGADYWMTRVEKDLGSLRARAEAVGARAADPAATERLAAASSALERFARLDTRARDYVRADQRLLASDLIYGEGFELTRSALGEIEAARVRDASFRAAETRRLHVQLQVLAAGIAGLGLLFLLILAVAPGAAARSTVPETQSSPASVLDLALSATPAGTVADARVQDRIPDEIGSAIDASLESAAVAPTTVDLGAAAELCLDLARVADPEEIPGLLDRITRVLDARGIVLWMADPDGRELVPTVAHGYAASALARLGTIERDSDNATAAAFRESRTHIVRGDALVEGAVVVPLVTAGGCIGVMAAEVRNQREQQEEVRAVASMLAAQLATLIGVSPVAQREAKAN